MQALKKIFSPGHDVDDELMYGDGTKKAAVEKPSTTVDNEPHPPESRTEGAATQPSGTATSDLEPPARPQAQEGISTASIKSGVVGHPEESRLMSETTDQPSGAAFTQDSSSYPSGAQSTDFTTRSNPQTDPRLTQSRGAEQVSAGKTSAFSSNPIHKSDNTSRHVDRESKNPTPHRQPEQSKNPIRGAGDEGESTRALGSYSQPEREGNTYASERGFIGAGGTTTGRGNEPASRESVPAQYPKADPNNPYSSSRLDPRVDPHAKPSTSIVSSNDTMNRPSEYGSGSDNQGLSGTKTTAEPLDRAKGYSQIPHGPKGTTERFDGPKGTSEPLQSSTGTSEPKQDLEGSSWPLKEPDQPHSRVEVMPGAFDSEAFVTEISRDPVPEDKTSYYDFGSSIAGGGTTEATQGPKGTAEPLIEETKYLSGTGGVPSASTPGVSGGETTTFDSPSQTATASYGIASSPFATDPMESMQGPKGTAEPLGSSRDSSWPLREQGTDQYQTSAGVPPGTSGLSGYSTGNRSDHPAQGAETSSYGVGSSQGVGSVSERSQPTNSGLDTLDTNNAIDEGHKGRNAGILGATAGALGLGAYAAKKHGEDMPDRPSAGTRRESIPTTAYPPSTSLDDKQYPEARVEGYGATPSWGQDTNEAPYTGGASQAFTRTGTATTQPMVGAIGTSGAPTAMSNYAVGNKQEESHMGRNVALGGAAAVGASALGAHEYSRRQAEKPATAASDYIPKHEPEQGQYGTDRLEERQYGRDAAVDGIAAPSSTHGYPQQQFEKPSAASSDYASRDKPDERHYGRDAAIIGGGGGALAAGVGAVNAHEYSQHRSEKPSTVASEYTARNPPEERYHGGDAVIGSAAAAGPGIAGTPEHSRHQAEKSSTATPGSTTGEKPQESHLGRNAAIGGVAAAGAGAVGAHEYSQHEAEIEAQQRVEAEKAHQKAMEASRKAAEKEQKDHDKALAKEEKEHEKALQKEEKKAEKEHEKAVHREEKKAEKEHEKLVKKEEKEHEKALKKEEKEHQKEHEAAIKLEEKKQKEHEKELARQQKEAEKQRDSDEKEKKHGGLLGLFRRRKDSKGNDVEDEDDHTAVKTSTSATDEDSHEHGKRHIFGLPHHEVKHKLHKDPPPGLYSGDSTTPAYADYAVKENNHPGAQTVTGGYTAPDPEHDRNRYSETAGPGSGNGASGTNI
ncbi:hypothetical protein EPUS_02876 [Endocarpon pusillum Z07020]|uniref:Uncharacterized protein n=1 Tax=Endocarpon pusillum (strain Z07020 / HMAS-L-300199) TaxID=1263415 RepID=U1HTJ9_ENDPU|nr:uncharacterized protein EPUS_02876 [Endocarpon pusillum Z07020]ERF72594.1 hypothetical protein EPUS_02876 [Endocarpon pusillum Z07020]